MSAVVLIFAFLSGAAAGWIVLKIAAFIIKTRVGIANEYWLTTDKKSIVFWALLSGISWLWLVYIFGLTITTAEFVLIFSVCMLISVIDIAVRKIPNELVVLVILCAIWFMFLGDQKIDFKDHILGLFASAGLF